MKTALNQTTLSAPSSYTSPLAKLIHKLIEDQGPLSISQYMKLCLTHPSYGVYSQDSPIGQPGHFITAPEVSQLFGEMIGIWAVLKWQAMGYPKAFNLVEIGPGHGTLMQDLLRGTLHIPEFHSALNLHFIDINRSQKEKQRQKVSPYPHASTHWHQSLTDYVHARSHAETDLAHPTILIANEFLDCLPVNQLIYHKNSWRERKVGLHQGKLVYTDGSVTLPPKLFHFFPAEEKEGALFEWMPDLEEILQHISQLIHQTGGAFLLIDYGLTKTPGQNTLQGISHHQKVSPFFRPGETDLTTLVPFHLVQFLLQNLFSSQNILFSTQKDFLERHGFQLRKEMLSKKISPPDTQKKFLSSAQYLIKEMDNFYTLEGSFTGNEANNTERKL